MLRRFMFLISFGLIACPARWLRKTQLAEVPRPNAGVSQSKACRRSGTRRRTSPGRRSAGPRAFVADRLGRTHLPDSVNPRRRLRGREEGLYFGGERMKAPDVEQRGMVYCLDVKTGKNAVGARGREGQACDGRSHQELLRSETPVTDGERVYAYFGNQGLFCYDLEGKRSGRKSGSRRRRSSVGHGRLAGAPQGRLYVVNDNEKRSFMVCLDAKTGEQVWEIERDETSNWATRSSGERKTH